MKMDCASAPLSLRFARDDVQRFLSADLRETRGVNFFNNPFPLAKFVRQGSERQSCTGRVPAQVVAGTGASPMNLLQYAAILQGVDKSRMA